MRTRRRSQVGGNFSTNLVLSWEAGSAIVAERYTSAAGFQSFARVSLSQFADACPIFSR